MKNMNFVYVANDYLRHLEKEFSDGISNALGETWTSTSSLVKYKKQAVNMTFFIYRRSHIMMSHGLADKNYLLREDAQGGLEINKYRYVCVPGTWLKRKLLANPRITLKEEQIKVVGWPRIDNLLRAQQEQKKLSTYSSESEKVKVLWAPTHGGGNVDGMQLSSYPSLLQFEDELKKEFIYSRSLHPAIEKSGKSTFDKLLEADVVISDRGTLVYEAWALGKPVIFPSWLIKEANLKKVKGSAETYIFQNEIGIHATSFSHLMDLIKSRPILGDDVKDFLSDYLDPSTYGKSYELISNVVEEVWESQDLRVKPKAPKIKED